MDPVTSEKNTAVFRYNILQNITAFFRLLEALALTALALWCSAHASDIFDHVFPVLLGPRFVFLLANIIVLYLLLIHSHSHTSTTTASISHECISAAFSVTPPPDPVTPVALCEDREGEVVFEDKRVVSVGVDAGRTCGRSRSVRVRARQWGSSELRRSETDVGNEEKEEEEEGDDEFRQMIEAFIEKQWEFQKKEFMAMAIVAAN